MRDSHKRTKKVSNINKTVLKLYYKNKNQSDMSYLL